MWMQNKFQILILCLQDSLVSRFLMREVGKVLMMLMEEEPCLKNVNGS